MSLRVSIIILNAFQTDNLISCLNSVLKNRYENYEVIVVDYGTKDIEKLYKKYNKVKFIHLEGEDIGPSAMHNIGIKNSDPLSEYVVFLDNDIIVDKSWLLELTNCIKSDITIGAAQSKILLLKNPNIVNSYGNKCNFLAVGWPDGYGEKNILFELNKEISFPSGASMILRKDVLYKIGLFDEKYFIYLDDLDVGLKMKIFGYKIMYCSNSIVYHDYKFLKNKRNFFYLNRNRLFTFFKLYDGNSYKYMIIPFIFYECSIFWYAIFNGYLFEIFKIYRDLIHNINYIKKERINISKIKNLNDSEFIRSLEGAISFNQIENPGVKYILNPVLDKWKNLLIQSLKEKNKYNNLKEIKI